MYFVSNQTIFEWLSEEIFGVSSRLSEFIIVNNSGHFANFSFKDILSALKISKFTLFQHLLEEAYDSGDLSIFVALFPPVI